jgi:phosphatidylglycerol:prolipoprotein diacylglycerol transferase
MQGANLTGGAEALRFAPMVLATLPFPDIDRVALHIWGPLAIRLYALAYIAGLLFGWWAAARMSLDKQLWKNPPFAGKAPLTVDQVGDLVVWATFGVILGGRIGWILFYGIALCSVSPHSTFCLGPPGQPGLPLAFISEPWRLITIWQGGMSFHGGLAGVAIALWLFCRRHKLALFQVSDMLAVVAPIGLFFGRLANFVNGELWGKVTDVPWGMVFCTPHILQEFAGICPAGMQPRHPSQLYEAALEGLALFAILQLGLRAFRFHERPGLQTGIFLAGYGVFRFCVEFFREPDGPFLGWFSMGMALSIPLWLAAVYLLWVSLAKPARA